MSRALILGGTGAIRRATATRLLAAGWQVSVTGRNPAAMPTGLTTAGATFIRSERQDHDNPLAALGDAPDLLVDCVCYTAADAANGGEDADLLPGPDDEFFKAHLDYRAEDDYLAGHPQHPLS